ncbi:MAG TPA: hypothetical protein VF062_10735 [Candidatus Limnocylindrales bacterium]
MDEMKTLTELGADLYPEHGPSPQLQNRALGVAPRTGRRSWRPLLAVAATVTVIATGTAIVVSDLDGPNAGSGAHVGGVRAGNAPVEVVETKPAAFTVRTNADGSVTFAVTDLVDVAAATQALNAAGVAGRVVNIPNESCPVDKPNVNDLALDSHEPNKAGLGNGPGLDESVTVTSTAYPSGGGLLVIVQIVQVNGQMGAGLVAYPYKDVDNIPTCLRLAFGQGN